LAFRPSEAAKEKPTDSDEFEADLLYQDEPFEDEGTGIIGSMGGQVTLFAIVEPGLHVGYELAFARDADHLLIRPGIQFRRIGELLGWDGDGLGGHGLHP